jgi:hypothetical protein
MTKQDLCIPPPKYRTDAGSDIVSFRFSQQSRSRAQEPAPRLIVLIPTGSDHTSETGRIWKLANTRSSGVLLLGRCQTAAEEPSLRRQLVTMSALIGNNRVATEVMIEIGTSWVNAVKAICQPDDMIVCFAEHRVGLLHRPLHQILGANLEGAVTVLSELHPQSSNPGVFSEVVVWLGSTAIIAGFGILQVRIAQLPKDLFQTVLFILSTIFEFWLIWVWNNLND